MKKKLRNISICLLAVAILIASVGVNIFRHICNTCYESYITIDFTPNNIINCCLDGNCQCEHHDENHSTNLDSKINLCNSHDIRSYMDDHQHDYMQIDKLYSTQNKLVDFYCDALIIKNFEINYNKPIIENVELLHDLYVIKPTNPEISILNCCFIC